MKKPSGWLVFGLLIGGVLCAVRPALATDGFSREKALEHLKILAETIGPRPLGTPQEKAALTYFAEKLAEIGCQVEWQAVTGGKGRLGSNAVNTNSFNVIGRLSGTTAREIIVGAHIDSSTPEIPGANDDGSGVATIIEVARVLAREPHDATLVFVAFCGEESGLIGSRSFVEHYPLENVALMLQLDMVSDDSPLLLFVDTKKSQTPPWLVSASIEAFHSLGYRNMEYPVFFQSLNSAIDGASSDHAPFLEKGIPAIGFVTDLSFPIHTPNDSLEYFKPAGLERSGRLILELMKKFDDGQPAQKAGNYMLVLIGEKPLFAPLSWLKVLVILSLIIGLVTFIRLYRIRKLQTSWEEDRKVRKSWPKLVVHNVIIVVAMFCALWLMQRLSGLRAPWYAHPGPYVIYAFVFFVFGIWLSLQLTRKWRLRRNSFFYFARASIYLAALTGLAWLASGPRLALFPAAGLLFISLACLAPWAWLKGLLWLLAPFWIFRMLVLSEGASFVFRTAAMGMTGLKTFVLNLLVWTALGLFFIAWTMPFLLGFAAVHRSARGDLWAMKPLRRLIALIPIGILAIGGAVYLRTVPAYDGPWKQEVAVTQRLDAENKTAVEFSSFGSLRGIQATIGGREVLLDGRRLFKRVEMPLEMNWMRQQVTSQTEEKGEETIIHLGFRLDFEKMPYEVRLQLKSDRAFSVDNANVNYQHNKDEMTIRWAHDPGLNLAPEMAIRLPKGAKLDADIGASFLDLPVPVSCIGKDICFIHRAEIKRQAGIGSPI
jgi:Peptidase family M28